MAPRRVNPDQQSLIIVSEQSGQMYVPELYDPHAGEFGAHGSLIAHYIHLQNTISSFAELSMLRGYVKRDDMDARDDDKPHMDPGHRANVEARIAQVARQAQDSFYLATAGSTLMQPGPDGQKLFTWGAVSKEGALDTQLFAKFHGEYYGPEKYKKAQAYRREIVGKTRLLQLESQTKYNRANELRPHLVRPVTAQPEKTDDDQMDTPTRLRAIWTDPRAGYLPATNREKNQVLSFLDYLDNPKFPLGVNNQFLEVFNKSQVYWRKDPEIDSERGPVSITYELGDYLANAIEQRAALEELESLLAEAPNLRLTVANEYEQGFIDPKHPGFAALLRYKDIKQFMETGEATLRNDPLLVKEDRWKSSKSKDPGRHKIVEDRYTGRKRPESMTEAIYAATAAMTIGEARELIGPAIVDQVSRESLLRVILEAIAEPRPATPSQARQTLLKASNAAHEILEQSRAA